MQRYIKVRIEDSKTGFPVVTGRSIRKSELHELKKQARIHAPVDWTKYPEEIKHIVFYTELRDYDNNPYYAEIYLNGACRECTEKNFIENFQKPRMHVIAKHRKVEEEE